MLAIPVQSPECACNTKITSEAQRVRETSGFTSEVMPINTILQCRKTVGKKKQWAMSAFKSWQPKSTRDIISPVLSPHTRTHARR